MPRNPANRNIYMRPDFYFVNSDIAEKLMNLYNEASKSAFVEILERDRVICERKMKDDSTIWQVKK